MQRDSSQRGLMNLLKGWSVRSTLLTVVVAVAVALAARLVIGRGVWPDAPTQEPGTGDAAAVSGSSIFTDRLIQGLQSRLSYGQEDGYSYTLLGSAYLQKARETGDPGYYTMAEGIFHRALTLSPRTPKL